MMNCTRLAASTLALVTASPLLAQDNVEVLARWNYSTLYTSGWSVENMFDVTEVIDANGEAIGDVENVVFSDEGKVLGLIAEVGGVWDIGDTHIHIPWEEVEMGDTVEQAMVPVTEETIDQYDVFDDDWLDECPITQADTDATEPVDDDLAAGPNIFKVTVLIGDYAHLSDGVRYGYIADIIVEDGAIDALVTDAATYGRRGYFAYPYDYGGVSPATGPRYDMPYTAQELDTIENFDYEQLQSRSD